MDEPPVPTPTPSRLPHWLPIVLIFMITLVNRRDLMGSRVNSPTFNVVAWITIVATIALTLILLYFGFFHGYVLKIIGHK